MLRLCYVSRISHLFRAGHTTVLFDRFPISHSRLVLNATRKLHFVLIV
jgi:hypothetical protein